ncbi:hypothetical protein SAMN05216559_4185 [Halomicrobium zhouii]|uniref:Uncharacterized protein n=1 Tax=Halomicrobium zhouii TaxID=767519 RepID=A0A1I6MBG3_9EURY|nr:hypothetical protein [Halomicrobium zhouii]SFS13044.1 hypothetical protein SAMN05216559_4185 [Halomicrobium zhouii]
MAGPQSRLQKVRSRWKYMDSNYKTVLVVFCGAVLLMLLAIGASSTLYGSEPSELAAPSLTTQMDCTGDGPCVFDVAVSSTGDADEIVVAYEPVGENSSTTTVLGKGESTTVESRSTVVVYTRHDDTSRIHSTYQPTASPANATNDSDQDVPQANVVYDQSGNDAGDGTNVSVTLDAVENGDTVTVTEDGNAETLSTGETLDFTGLRSQSEVTVGVEHDGAVVVVQKYTVLVSNTTDWSG